MKSNHVLNIQKLFLLIIYIVTNVYPMLDLLQNPQDGQLAQVEEHLLSPPQVPGAQEVQGDSVQEICRVQAGSG